MSNLVDLRGLRVGKLVVISVISADEQKQRLWEYQCDCGNKTTLTTGQLMSHITLSCGCKHNETNLPLDTNIIKELHEKKLSIVDIAKRLNYTEEKANALGVDI